MHAHHYEEASPYWDALHHPEDSSSRAPSPTRSASGSPFEDAGEAAQPQREPWGGPWEAPPSPARLEALLELLHARAPTIYGAAEHERMVVWIAARCRADPSDAPPHSGASAVLPPETPRVVREDVFDRGTLGRRVVDIPDSVLRLGILREAAGLVAAGVHIEDRGRKVRYAFDGTFDSSLGPGPPAAEVAAYLGARIAGGRDSCLLTIGLSGSGKSTHVGQVLDDLGRQGLLAGATYSLAESYLGKCAAHRPPRDSAHASSIKSAAIRVPVPSLEAAEAVGFRFNAAPCDLTHIIESFARRARTANNETSSRSQLVLAIHTPDPAEPGRLITTRLVDMAGSERASSKDAPNKRDPTFQAHRQRLAEAQSINSDFSAVSIWLKARSRGKNVRVGPSPIVRLLHRVGSVAVSILLHDTADTPASLWLRTIKGLIA